MHLRHPSNEKNQAFFGGWHSFFESLFNVSLSSAAGLIDQFVRPLSKLILDFSQVIPFLLANDIPATVRLLYILFHFDSSFSRLNFEAVYVFTIDFSRYQRVTESFANSVKTWSAMTMAFSQKKES